MESLIPPFDAYKGKAPYIFVSYAHKNADLVFERITRLHNEGFRIWYDEGIDPGADWSDDIANALGNATVFLVFISAASVASQNVRKEIVYAIDQRKYIVAVHLEETDLPAGLRMQLGNIQALLEPRFVNKEKFFERLREALKPESTCGDERHAVPVPVARSGATRGDSWFARNKKALLGAAAGLLLCLAVALGWFFLGQSGGSVTFADRQLEAAIRGALHKPDGSISVADMGRLTGKLDLSSRGLTDITPLRHAVNVSALDLDHNQLTDITALGEMRSLTVLGLDGNKISDFTALGKLPALMGLSIQNNPIADYKQLRALRPLEILVIGDTPPLNDMELGRFLVNLKSLLHEGKMPMSPADWQRFRQNLPPSCTVKITVDGKEYNR